LANAIDIPSADIQSVAFADGSAEFLNLPNKRAATRWGLTLLPRAEFASGNHWGKDLETRLR
jgi:hypothetical protein